MYNNGTGICQDTAGKAPRWYYKAKAFSTVSGCRDLCTTLAAACVGYAFAVSGNFTGDCYVYGSMLPDKGTGAAAPGQALDRWNFFAGNLGGIGGSNTLHRVFAERYSVYECHAKQPGASGMHPPMPTPPTPNTL